MRSFLDCVDDAYTIRWVGSKNGERSRDRALACIPSGHHGSPVGAVLNTKTTGDLVQTLREQGLSNGTINRSLAALSTVWRLAHQNGHHPSPPPLGVYLKEKGGRMRVITETELGGLVAEILPAYQGLVVFLFETGCRVGEALKLAPRDYDRTGRRVTFRDTKTSEDRTVPLSSRAKLVLDRAPVDLFGSISQSSFNHSWSTARERMGLQDDKEFCPHALRHGAVTRWIVAGVPLPVVSQMAGHRSYKTTARYAHPTVEHAQQALEKAGLL